MIGDAGGFGVSFLPNGDQRYQRERPGATPLGGGAGRAPIQEAVQVLNMRVPRVLGGAPISPFALLDRGMGSGSGGVNEAQLNQLMRTLGLIPDAAMGASAPGGPASPALTGAPSPFAVQSTMRPMSAPSGGAGVGISAATGSSDPGSLGGAMPPPPRARVQPGAARQVEVSAPSGPSMPGEAGQDSEALWDLARRQREAMMGLAY